jgi:hypothetical protein
MGQSVISRLFEGLCMRIDALGEIDGRLPLN